MPLLSFLVHRRDVPPKSWSIPEVRILVIRRTDGRTNDYEEKPVHRGADRPRPASGGGRHPGRGGLPQARRIRADLLPLETPVRRDGGGRAATAAAGRGGEPQAQAAGGRPE